MNIICYIIMFCFVAMILLFLSLTIYALINEHPIDRLSMLKERLRYAIEETMDELRSFQVISKKYDAEEKLFQVETNIERMIDEIKESPPQKISDVKNYYLRFKKITNQLIDYCDEPEKYFKEMKTAEEG